MTTTTERPATHDLPTEIYEMWRSSMETLNWSQDQADTMIRATLDQARTLRHDGIKVLDQLALQAKDNTQEMMTMVENNWKSAMEQVPGWDAMTGEGMRKQFDEFAKRFESLYQR